MLKITLDKLNISPSECVVIEDSVAGIIAAKKLNISVFGLMTYYSAKELNNADKIFKNHIDILSYLKMNWFIDE